MMKKIALSAVLAALILSGCGGGDAKEQVAYYVDSAVEGVHYECDNGNKGTTGKEGAFDFGNATECTFSLAGIPLRTVKGDDLKAGTKLLEDNPKVAQLLQSLDTDGDPDKGGITVDEEAFKKALEKAGLKDQTDLPTEEELKKVIAKMPEADKDYKGNFVEKKDAKKHVEETKNGIKAEEAMPESTKAFSISALKTLYAKTKVKELIKDLKNNGDKGVKHLLEGRDDAKCQSGTFTSTETGHDSMKVTASQCAYDKWIFDGAGYFQKDGGGSSDANGGDKYHGVYEAKATKDITVSHATYGKLTIASDTFGRLDEHSEGTNTHDDQSGKSENKQSISSTIKTNGSFEISGVKVVVADLFATTTNEYYDTSTYTEDKNTYHGEETSTVTLERAVFTLGEYAFKLDTSKNSKTTLERTWANDKEDTSKVSGVIYLKDGAGHSVEISFADYNAATLKVDENGDGKFSASETLKIDREFIGY
jgi:hypothetical protein